MNIKNFNDCDLGEVLNLLKKELSNFERNKEREQMHSSDCFTKDKSYKELSEKIAEDLAFLSLLMSLEDAHNKKSNNDYECLVLLVKKGILTINDINEHFGQEIASNILSAAEQSLDNGKRFDSASELIKALNKSNVAKPIVKTKIEKVDASKDLASKIEKIELEYFELTGKEITLEELKKQLKYN